ncbi:MAG: DUF2099 family protein [Candidatus Methanomethylophilaceae archaeon]|nr:DUF2099 family protein [Candidatus Methanomethylophilaceae archaeon]
MSRHVMECLGMSRVTIVDGKVVEVTEPRVRYCPLFAKYRGLESIDSGVVRENIEFRISSFGMCSEDRETHMGNFLSFGVSETLSTALSRGDIDAAVIAADGCGTAVITDPEIVQGMGGRISGICETEPIARVVEAIGPENMLDPETARIDMVAGADKAAAMGFGRFAVTTPFVEHAREIRARHGERAVIIGVHTTGMSAEDAEEAFDLFDIITACASKNLREVCRNRPDTLIAGNKVPIYAITPIGKKLIGNKLEELGREPWDGSVPEEPPVPLL